MDLSCFGPSEIHRKGRQVDVLSVLGVDEPAARRACPMGKARRPAGAGVARAGSDSEDEDVSLRVPRKVNRFRFKTFAERIQDVDLRVYRSARLAPRPVDADGNVPFFQEELWRWRELNAAKDFLDVVKEISPYVHSLPQILHHKDQIIDAILLRLKMSAEHSLEPLLSLLGSLARDLQAEYLSLFPRLVQSLSFLLLDGCTKVPELLEVMFSSLCWIFKYNSKQLSTNLHETLRHTAILRYFPDQNVQKFMSESMTYLFRTAKLDHMQSGIRCLMAENATARSDYAKNAVAITITQMLLGVQHGLHSKAAVVLHLILRREMPTAEETETASKSILFVRDWRLKMLTSQKEPSFEAMPIASKWDECTMRLTLSLTEKLCVELRREKSSLLWETLSNHLNFCLGDVMAKHGDTRSIMKLADAVELVSQVVEHRGGSRVASYEDLFLLIRKLLPICSNKDICSFENGHALIGSLHRLLVAIVWGHQRAIGASKGPLAVAREAQLHWGPAFTVAEPKLVLQIIQKIMELRFPPDSMSLFYDHLLAGCAHCIVDPLLVEEASVVMLSLCEGISTRNGIYTECISRLAKNKSIKGIVDDYLACPDKPEQFWFALRMLPYLYRNSSTAIELCRSTASILAHSTWSQDISTAIACQAWRSEAVILLHGGSAPAELFSLVAKSLECFNATPAPCVADTAVFLLEVVGKMLHVEPHVLWRETGVANYLSSKRLQALLPALSVLYGSDVKEERIVAARLASFFEPSVWTTDALDDDIHNVFLAWHRVETKEITLVSSRHSVLVIEKVIRAIDANHLCPEFAQVMAAFMLAALKVQFSVIWKPASKAIGTLMKKYPKKIWPIFEDNLTRSQKNVLLGSLSESVSTEHKSCQSQGALALQFAKFRQLDQDVSRLDHASLFSQLLDSLTHAPEVWSMFGPQLLELFLEYSEQGSTRPNFSNSFNRKTWKGGLRYWLALLALYKTPKKFVQAERFFVVLMDLLTIADPSIQLGVLQCLRMWKLPYLDPYMERLQGLCKSSSLRDELVRFPLWPGATLVEEKGSGSKNKSRKLDMSPSSVIAEEHRSEILSLIIRILYPRLKRRNGVTVRRGNTNSVRAPVLNALAGLRPAELNTLFQLLLKPFESCFLSESTCTEPDLEETSKLQTFASECLDGRFLRLIDITNIAMIRRKVQIAFIDLMYDFIQHMPSLMVSYLDLVLSLSFALSKSSFRCLDSQVNIHEQHGIRKAVTKLWILIFQHYEELDFSVYWPVFHEQVMLYSAKLEVEALSATKTPPTLQLLGAICSSSTHSRLFLTYPQSKDWLVSAVKLLEMDSIHFSVQSAVFILLQSLSVNLGVEEFQDALGIHIDTLISCLQSRLQSPLISSKQRASSRHLIQHELAMLQVLADCVKTEEQCRKMIESFVQFLRKSKDENHKVMALQALASLVRNLTHFGGNLAEEDLVVLVQALTLQIGGCIGSSFQASLSEVFSSLGNMSSSLSEVSNLCAGLNAMVAGKVEEVDYETRLSCYSSMTETFWQDLVSPHLQAAPLLHFCFRDLRDAGDLALRHGSSACLTRYLRSAQHEHKGISDTGKKGTLSSLLPRVVYPCIKSGLTSNNLAVRQEHVSILRALAVMFPTMFPVLFLLTNPDEEADILQNIMHIQSHRISRSLARLKKAMQEKPMVAAILLDVLLPILLPYILDAKDSGGLSESAIEVLQTGAKNLVWRQLRQLLNRLLQLLHKNYKGTEEDDILAHLDLQGKKKSAPHRALVRSICAVLDALKDSPRSNWTEPTQTTSVETDLMHDEAQSMEHKEEKHDFLSNKVLPILKSMLKEGTESVCAHVALANIKLLQCLPREQERKELPYVLQSVCNMLKNRSQDTRDKTRKVLQSIMTELGPYYLPYLIEVLTSVLTKGYQVHVLGYTIHFVLDSIVRRSKVHQAAEKPASLPAASDSLFDECMPLLLPLLETDIFGHVNEERDVEKISSSMREAKTCMSYDTFQLLAQGITFHSHFWQLLEPVRSRLPQANHFSTGKKLEEILVSVSKGLFLNKSATATDILAFIHNLIESGVSAQEEEKEDQEEKKKTARLVQASTARSSSAKSKEDRLPNQHLLMFFALSVLHYGLKHDFLKKNTQPNLEPLTSLLVCSARSKHSNVSALSVKCLCSFIPLKLDSVEVLSTEIADLAYAKMRRCGDSNSSLAQSCLKLLCALFNCSAYQPPTYELVFLLKFAFIDLEDSATQATSFTLIKAIIKRKFVCAEVYELMEKIEKLLVSSHSLQVRTSCSQALLAFLLHYPLGEKRLQRHLRNLFANFEFQYEEGRMAAYDMIHAIVAKFPPDLLDAQFATFFFPLVSKLVSDPSQKCRARVGATLEALFQVVGDHSLNSALEYCKAWFTEGSLLQRTAYQVLGLLIDAGMHKRISKQLRALIPILISTLVEICNAEGEATRMPWQNIYFLTNTIWKLKNQGLVLHEDCDLAGLSHAIISDELLLHEHLWIRKSALRLILQHLDDCSAFASGTQLQSTLYDVNKQGRLAWALVSQLEIEDVDGEFVDIVIQSLVHVSVIIHAASREENQGLQSTVNGGSENGDCGWRPSIDWIARKISGRIATSNDCSAVARMGALNFLSMLVSKLGSQVTLESILPASSRAFVVLSATNGCAPPTDVVTAMENLQSKIREVVGSEALAMSYAKASEALGQKREKRKKAHALRALIDPEAHAMSKLKQSRKRKESKKRKIEEFRKLNGGRSMKRNRT